MSDRYGHAHADILMVWGEDIMPECLECPPDTVASNLTYGNGTNVFIGEVGSIYGASARVVKMSDTELIVFYETTGSSGPGKHLQKVSYNPTNDTYSLGASITLSGSTGGNVWQDAVITKIAEDRIIVVRHTGVVRDSNTNIESPTASVIEMYATDSLTLVSSQALSPGHLFGTGKAATQIKEGLAAVGSMWRPYAINMINDNTGGPDTEARYLFIKMWDSGEGFDVTQYDVPRSAPGFLGMGKSTKFAVNDHLGATFPIRLGDNDLVVTAFFVDGNHRGGSGGAPGAGNGFWGVELIGLNVEEVNNQIEVSVKGSHIVNNEGMDIAAGNCEFPEWDVCWHFWLFDLGNVRQLEGPCGRIAMSYENVHDHWEPGNFSGVFFTDYENGVFTDVGRAAESLFFQDFTGLPEHSTDSSGLFGMAGILSPSSFPYCDHVLWCAFAPGPQPITPDDPLDRGMYIFLGKFEGGPYSLLSHVPPGGNPDADAINGWTAWDIAQINESGIGHLLIYTPTRIALHTIKVTL